MVVSVEIRGSGHAFYETESPRNSPPESFLYEADESAPETPNECHNSVHKTFLDSYILIEPEDKIFHGRKTFYGNNLRKSSESNKTLSVVSPENSTLSIPRLTAHYDLDHSTGRRRGVAGGDNENLTFLSVSLFSLFNFNNSCDSWILNEDEAQIKASRKAHVIRKLLSQEIVFSMRMTYTCPVEKVQKLYSILFPQMTHPQSLDLGKFLKTFLGNVLTLNETTHYTSSTSEIIVNLRNLEALGDTNVTLQHLMEATMKEKDRTLLSVPRPALFLSLPSTLTSVPHSPLVPNLQLDLSPFLIHLRHDDSSSESDSELELHRFSRPKPSPKKPSMAKYVQEAFGTAFSHLEVMVQQLPQFFSPPDTLLSAGEDYITPSRDENVGNSVDTNQHKHPPVASRRPEVLMDLMAVICRDKNSKYTAFVRCGQNPRRGFGNWVFFDPLGEENVPEVRLLDRNFTKSLRRLTRLKQKQLIEKEWNQFPQEVQMLLNSCTFFMYDTKPSIMNNFPID